MKVPQPKQASTSSIKHECIIRWCSHEPYASTRHSKTGATFAYCKTHYELKRRGYEAFKQLHAIIGHEAMERFKSDYPQWDRPPDEWTDQDLRVMVRTLEDKLSDYAPFEDELQRRIDEHPEWQRQDHETRSEYQRRMLTLCQKLAKGALKRVPA